MNDFKVPYNIPGTSDNAEIKKILENLTGSTPSLRNIILTLRIQSRPFVDRQEKDGITTEVVRYALLWLKDGQEVFLGSNDERINDVKIDLQQSNDLWYPPVKEEIKEETGVNQTNEPAQSEI